MRLKQRMWVALGAVTLLHCGPAGGGTEGSVVPGFGSTWSPPDVGDAHVAAHGSTLWVAQQGQGIRCWDLSGAAPVVVGTLAEAGTPEALGVVNGLAVVSVVRTQGGARVRTLLTATCDGTAGPAVVDRWDTPFGGDGQVVITQDSVQVLDPANGVARAGVDTDGKLVSRFQSQGWNAPTAVLFPDYVLLETGAAFYIMRLDSDAPGFVSDWTVAVPEFATARMDGHTLLVVSGGLLRASGLVRGELPTQRGEQALGRGAEMTGDVPARPGVVVVATASQARVVDVSNPSAPRVLLDAPVITNVERNGNVLLVVGSAGRVHLVNLDTLATQDGAMTPAGLSPLRTAPLGSNAFLVANEDRGWVVRWSAEGGAAQVTDAPAAMGRADAQLTVVGDRVAVVAPPNVTVLAADGDGARVEGAASSVQAVEAVPLEGGARAWLEVADGMRTALVTSNGAREWMDGVLWMRLFHHQGRLAALVTEVADSPPTLHLFQWDGSALTRVGQPLVMEFSVNEDSVVQAEGRLAFTFGRVFDWGGWCGPCGECVGAQTSGHLRVVDFAGAGGPVVVGDVSLNRPLGGGFGEPILLRAAGTRVLVAVYADVADVDTGATPPTLSRTFKADEGIRDMDASRMTAVVGDGGQCTWGRLEGTGFTAVFATSGQSLGACVLGGGNSVVWADEAGQWWRARQVGNATAEELMTLRSESATRFARRVAEGTLLVAEGDLTRLLHFPEEGAPRTLWRGSPPWPEVRATADSTGFLLNTLDGLVRVE
jgi:hypothetical protein